MDYRELTPNHAVAPQIAPEDLRELADLGFVTVICNRPDAENPPPLHMDTIRSAAEAAGLRFVANPVAGGGITRDAVETQRDALSSNSGRVLAYCASGTRSAVLWAFAEAGTRPTEEILSATAQAGYALDGLAPQIEALAKSGR